MNFVNAYLYVYIIYLYNIVCWNMHLEISYMHYILQNTYIRLSKHPIYHYTLNWKINVFFVCRNNWETSSKLATSWFMIWLWDVLGKMWRNVKHGEMWAVRVGRGEPDQHVDSLVWQHRYINTITTNWQHWEYKKWKTDQSENYKLRVETNKVLPSCDVAQLLRVGT